MKLADLPHDFTDRQFMTLDKESLDQIPYTRLRWLCQCKGCKNGTHIRDYGLDGWYLLDRNSKHAAKNIHDYWMGRNNYWLCGKHNQLFKKLEQRFDFDHIRSKFIDVGKEVRIPVGEAGGLSSVEKIEGNTKHSENNNFRPLL